MKTKINDGGPAFPVPNDANVNEQPGMTLRDWFAGQALAGSGWGSWDMRCGFNKDLADKCYAKADAMLAERSKQP